MGVPNLVYHWAKLWLISVEVIPSHCYDKWGPTNNETALLTLSFSTGAVVCDVLFVIPFSKLVSNVCWDSLCVLVYLHNSLIVEKWGEKTYFQFFWARLLKELDFLGGKIQLMRLVLTQKQNFTVSSVSLRVWERCECHTWSKKLHWSLSFYVKRNHPQWRFLWNIQQSIFLQIWNIYCNIFIKKDQSVIHETVPSHAVFLSKAIFDQEANAGVGIFTEFPWFCSTWLFHVSKSNDLERTSVWFTWRQAE